MYLILEIVAAVFTVMLVTFIIAYTIKRDELVLLQQQAILYNYAWYNPTNGIWEFKQPAK